MILSRDILQSDWTRDTTKSNQKWYSKRLPSLDGYLHAKNLRHGWFPSEILMIKECYDLIEQKANLATPVMSLKLFLLQLLVQIYRQSLDRTFKAMDCCTMLCNIVRQLNIDLSLILGLKNTR